MQKSPIRFIAKSELKEVRKQHYSFQNEMVSLIRATTGRKLNRPWYTLVENGKRAVKADMAITISRLLEAELEDIFNPDLSGRKGKHATA